MVVILCVVYTSVDNYATLGKQTIIDSDLVTWHRDNDRNFRAVLKTEMLKISFTK